MIDNKTYRKEQARYAQAMRSCTRSATAVVVSLLVTVSALVPALYWAEDNKQLATPMVERAIVRTSEETRDSSYPLGTVIFNLFNTVVQKPFIV